MRTIERRWPLNVESDCATDCSSPMSAKTSRKTGSRLPGAAGTCSPDWCISASRPSGPQRDGLAARVGAGDDERRVVAAEADVDGHDIAPTDPGGAPTAAPPLAASRSSARAPSQLLGEPRLGRPEVELRPAPRASRRRASACVATSPESSSRMRSSSTCDRELCLAPGVAQLDRHERLDEQGLAASRLVVDDALDPGLGIGPDGHDVAAVAQRDDAAPGARRRARAWTSCSSRRAGARRRCAPVGAGHRARARRCRGSRRPGRCSARVVVADRRQRLGCAATGRGAGGGHWRRASARRPAATRVVAMASSSARHRGGRRGRARPTAGPMSRAPPTPTSGRSESSSRAWSVSSRRRVTTMGSVDGSSASASRRDGAERRVGGEPRADDGRTRAVAPTGRPSRADLREGPRQRWVAADAEAPRPLRPSSAPA